MSQQLVNRNDDIRRLVDKGYAIAFDSSNYLVVRDIPYLDSTGGLRWGAIVSKFVDRGNDLITQDDHQVYFAGEIPHRLDGTAINLGGGAHQLALSEDSHDVVVQRSFSNKRKVGGQLVAYVDFYEKISTYVEIISGPAIDRHGVTPLTYRARLNGPSDSPFKIRDTLTSRAEIGDLAAKFKNEVVVVIGLGGTGAYLLDFLVKTPVREVRAYDDDAFHVHNAFRSPGKVDPESELDRPKPEVYQARYESFRNGLIIKRKLIDAGCAEDLRGATFAFVCVDKGSARAEIFRLLISLGIPFIDVGMGLDRKNGALNGMLRTTYYSVENAHAQLERGLAELTDGEGGLYRTNIQIGELNSLNASLAVLKFKQLRGYYHDGVGHENFVFQIGKLKVLGDATTHND